MFENCKTLAELNKQRAGMIKSGKSPKEVNSLYNAVKVSIMSQQPTITDIPVFYSKQMNVPTYTAMPLVGMAEDANNLVFTEKGILI